MAYEDKYPLALKAGTVLAGQFVIERVLGQGGFGITYAAVDHKTGQRVAVKEFFPDSMATRADKTTVVPFTGERGESFVYGKDCFLKEAETLAQFIGNENIVRIHSYFEENGTAYFVMDYVEGSSFDVYIRKQGGKISYEDAKRILVPVMDALGAVHARGIIHRDVTPDNIYITTKGVVKLLDFGAARYSLGDKSRSLDVVLKHGFAPKEQYTRRGKQGPYTDVYALGATFYYALTGRRPPDSVERMEVDELVPPSAMGAKIPEAAEQAILQALNVAAQERFQSMAAFKQALLSAEAADAQNAAAQQPLVQQPMQQQPIQQPVQQQPIQQPLQQQPVAGRTGNMQGTQGFDMLLGKPAAQQGQGAGLTDMSQRQTELLRSGQQGMQQPGPMNMQQPRGGMQNAPAGMQPGPMNMQQPQGGMQNGPAGMQQPGPTMMQQPRGGMQNGPAGMQQPGPTMMQQPQGGIQNAPAGMQPGPMNMQQPQGGLQNGPAGMQQPGPTMMQQPQGGMQNGPAGMQQPGPTMMQQPQGGMQNGRPNMQQPGGAVPPAGQNIQQGQTAGNKKTGLIIGIVAAAVVLIGLIVGGVIFFVNRDKPGDDQIAANTPTPIPTSTPTPTHAPTKAPDPTTPPEPTEEPTLAVQQPVLDKNPSVINVNNVQCGSYLDWDPVSYLMFVSDYEEQMLYALDIENDDISLINNGENRSFTCADDTLYFVSNGCAYTADVANDTKVAIPELSAYDDIDLLYVSEQAFYIYRHSEIGKKTSRVECVARESGTPMGTVVLGFEGGDPDNGALQFTFCNGYFYYVLQSNNGRDYDVNAPIKVWRLPAGDFNDAPYAVLQDSSANKQKYRQLISEGSDLFLLLENPDGRCGIVMYDTLTEKIEKNVNWGTDDYYFNFMNIYDGKLYVYADVVAGGYKAILTMNKDDENFGTPDELCRLDDVNSLFSVQIMEMEGYTWLIYYGVAPDGEYRMVILDTNDPKNIEVLIGGQG